MLSAFNNGDLHAYDALCSKYSAQLNAQPALVADERKLREKITIACLMELIFTCAALTTWLRPLHAHRCAPVHESKPREEIDIACLMGLIFTCAAPHPGCSRSWPFRHCMLQHAQPLQHERKLREEMVFACLTVPIFTCAAPHPGLRHCRCEDAHPAA